MTQEELNKIVKQHQHWLKEDCDGWEDMRAYLRGADLNGVDLSGVDLSMAYLSGTNLSGTNLSGANLYMANLSGADLYRANLYMANLSMANLSGADLSGAYLSGADLYRTNLSGVGLRGAYLSEDEKFRLGKVLDEPLTGYKKTREGVVITAEIPVGAIVFCINGSKCRTNRAKITDMDGHEVLHSSYDDSFKYSLGQEINIKDFNLMYNVECARGFHFFRTRKEAEDYIG